MKVIAVAPKDLRIGDLILTVDLGGYEELAKVNMVDNEYVWTESFVDFEECKESFYILQTEYKVIFRIESV